MATLERVDSLMIDKALYTRERVDPRHVVDGVHRLFAVRAVHGHDAKIPVEWRTYEDAAEVLLDSIKRNATHGRRFDAVDLERCWGTADRLQVAPGMLARAFSVTVERLRELSLRPASPEPSPLLAVARPVVDDAPSAPRSPRPPVSAADARARLVSQATTQLTRALERGQVDWTRPALVAHLRHLQALLTAGLLSAGEDVA
jgi:hypothetical protein